jgi:hypothetical protein
LEVTSPPREKPQEKRKEKEKSGKKSLYASYNRHIDNEKMETANHRGKKLQGLDSEADDA